MTLYIYIYKAGEHPCDRNGLLTASEKHPFFHTFAENLPKPNAKAAEKQTVLADQADEFRP
ncbi:MAG: hypothetical protein J6X98_08600 [Bacteroidales bacterium]|nr:hypothetical protein [Bacteroidales bacterium]